MSMLDPFNPRPGPLPGDQSHDRPADMAPRGSSSKSFLWVPALIVGGIGALFVVASL
jgi:hypothetical protein